MTKKGWHSTQITCKDAEWDFVEKNGWSKNYVFKKGIEFLNTTQTREGIYAELTTLNEKIDTLIKTVNTLEIQNQKRIDEIKAVYKFSSDIKLGLRFLNLDPDKAITDEKNRIAQKQIDESRV